MLGIKAWWRSMPPSKRLLSALIGFWLLYAGAALFEWTVDGKTDPAAAMAASTVATAPASPEEAAAMAGPPRQLTSGDLIVLLALAFIIAALSTIGVLARRELRGPGREQGMGAFDDPIWSGGDLELREPWLRGELEIQSPWLLGHAGPDGPPR
jgi:hypothetical protein